MRIMSSSVPSPQHVAPASGGDSYLLLAAGVDLRELLLHDLSDLPPLVAELQLQPEQQVVGLQTRERSDQTRETYSSLC